MLNNPPITPEAVDQVLPQTQCQLCGYKGCMPYAEAVINNKETIDRCLPGGVETLLALAKLTVQDATPYIEQMRQKAVPEQVAIIREDACIGCTKCIQVCPVDAIIGAAKQMHTIITDVCTGCGLCLPPCPVDCIDLVVTTKKFSAAEKRVKAEQSRLRYQEHNMRLSRKKQRQPSVVKQQGFDNPKAMKVSAEEIQQAINRVLYKKQKLVNGNDSKKTD